MGNKTSGIIGSLVMLSFGAISFYRFYTTGLIFFLLMVFRDVLAAWFLIRRNPNIGEDSNKFFALASYISSAIPLFYYKESFNNSNLVLAAGLISIIGFSISTLALIELGNSFGVSPANRGMISSGVYRFMNHPMYLGYVISEFGCVLLNPLNVIIYILSMSLYYLRAQSESKILKI
ncbi:MAG: methyltransferase [Bacteriovorax sp.]|nr:methyltransferase [Bacteriovorax sp.]